MHDDDRFEVLQLWVRERSGVPPVARASLDLDADQGVVGDHAYGGRRHVTFVFQEDWIAAEEALGTSVDPSARRANVLLTGGGGRSWVGTRMRLGSCLVEIHAETAPCGLMDETVPGLKDALAPDGRGGVWGRVLEGGRIAIGDCAEGA